MIHGPQEECVKALQSGHLLGISPGGVREALFSDETYPLLWSKRKGFAQVAIDSKVVRSCEHILEKLKWNFYNFLLFYIFPFSSANHSHVYSECPRGIPLSGKSE